MTDLHDLGFRPASFFGPHSLAEYVLALTKGELMRDHVRDALEAGLQIAPEEVLAATALIKEHASALERVHPAFMGGNYLPDLEPGEVEVARIHIRSTTGDVTAAYARLTPPGLQLRVVDEYNGDTLSGKTTLKLKRPPTLAEFIDFFMGVWSLIDAVNFNFEGDLEGSLAFFRGDSAFYPGFDAELRRRVRMAVQSTQHADEENEDGDAEEGSAG